MKAGEKNMKGSLLKQIPSFFLIAFLFLISACSRDLYLSAKEANTVEAYDQFLEQNPDHPSHALALKKREKLYYQKMVERSQEVRGDDVYYKAGFLDSYLLEYARGHFVKKAKRLREKNWFEQVRDAKDVELFDTYMAEYPRGLYLEQVNELKEELIFEIATKSNAVDAFDSYLLKYPQGQFITKAKDLQEKNWYKRAEKENSHKGYSTYLEEYPKGKFRSQVAEKVELLDYNTAKSKNTIQIYDLFLKEYPESKYSSEIKELRDTLWVRKAYKQVPFIRGAELEAWEFTKELDNIYQYNWFIKNFSKSDFIEEAKKRRQEKHISNQKLIQ